MVDNYVVQVRMSKQQKERLLLAMQNSGHKTVSGFIRSVVLEYDLSTQKKIDEIHECLLKNEMYVHNNIKGVIE
jgi:hypothetical protein